MNRLAQTKTADGCPSSVEVGESASDHTRKRLAEPIVLVVIIAIFSLGVVSLHPRRFFGYFQDDAIYFSIAKAFASGSGYSTPSFPGVLPGSRYPILYPFVLSAVWRFSPIFPDNLTWAIAMSIAIASAYLLLSYVFIRQVSSPLMGLCVLAALALHPELQWFAGALMSDFLFALLVVASVLAAEQAWLSSGRELYWACFTGLLLGLSVLTRSAGVGVIAGVVLYGVWQRRWRALLGIGVPLGGVGGVAAVAIHWLTPSYVAAGSGFVPPVFQRIATYNVSYARFWLLSVPSWSFFCTMLRSNLRILVATSGNYLVMPEVILPAGIFTFAPSLLLTTLAVLGIARLYRSGACRTMIFAALGSLPILLLWNYPFYHRFLFPFVPLIFLGMATEFHRIAALLRSHIQQGSGGTRVLAVLVGLLCIGLVVMAGLNYVQFNRQLRLLSQVETIPYRQQEGYDWIKHNTSPAERVVADADGLTYLYTGRQAINPVALTTDCYYQHERPGCTDDFDAMATWIGYVGAHYWLTTHRDFELMGTFFGPLMEQHAAALQHRLKPAFVGRDGAVTIYDTTCMAGSAAASCSDHVR